MRLSLGGAMRDESGQATVEAAFALPVLMVLVLLLVQPGIVMYDRIVMQGAAASACRLLATLPADQAELCEEYVMRRLGAIPPHEFFHVHDGGCTWEVEVRGAESFETVSVVISTKVRPLPLLGAASALLGGLDERGHMTVEVEAVSRAQPAWARESFAAGAASLPGAWLQER